MRILCSLDMQNLRKRFRNCCLRTISCQTRIHPWIFIWHWLPSETHITALEVKCKQLRKCPSWQDKRHPLWNSLHDGPALPSQLNTWIKQNRCKIENFEKSTLPYFSQLHWCGKGSKQHAGDHRFCSMAGRDSPSSKETICEMMVMMSALIHHFSHSLFDEQKLDSKSRELEKIQPRGWLWARVWALMVFLDPILSLPHFPCRGPIQRTICDSCAASIRALASDSWSKVHSISSPRGPWVEPTSHAAESILKSQHCTDWNPNCGIRITETNFLPIGASAWTLRHERQEEPWSSIVHIIMTDLSETLIIQRISFVAWWNPIQWNQWEQSARNETVRTWKFSHRQNNDWFQCRNGKSGGIISFQYEIKSLGNRSEAIRTGGESWTDFLCFISTGLLLLSLVFQLRIWQSIVVS
jgi:hypothetical protein